MKRFMCLLLAVILSGLVMPAAAEEPATVQGNFMAGIQSWLSRLSLDERDYMIDFAEAISGSSATASLKKDGALYELALDGLGKAQWDGEKLGFEINQQAFFLDLESLVHLLTTGNPGDVEELRMLRDDWELLRPWAKKILFRLLMPCVQLSARNGGFIVTVKADAADLLQSACALADEFLAEKETVEILLAHYSGILRTAFPNFPSDYDSLCILWREAKKQIRKPKLFADLTVSFEAGYTGFEILCVGDVQADVESWHADLSLIQERNSFYLKGNLASNDWLGGHWTDYTFDFSFDDHSLRGNYVCQRDRIRIAQASVSFDVAIREKDVLIRADAFYVGPGSVFSRKYYLDGSFDRDLKHLEGTLKNTWINRFLEEAEDKETIAAFSADRTSTGYTGRIQTYGYDYRFDYIQAVRYARLSVRSTEPRGNAWFCADIWVLNENGWTIKADISNKYVGVRYVGTLSLSPGRFEIEIVKPDYRGARANLTVQWENNGARRALDISYYNEIYDSHTFHPLINSIWYPYKDQPFHLALSQDSGGMEASLSHTGPYQKTEASVTVSVKSGSPIAFICAMTLAKSRTGENRKNYRLSWIPGTVTYVDDSGFYEIMKTTDTPGCLTYRLTKNHTDVLCTLDVLLEENDVLKLIISEEQEIGYLEIIPIEKEPVLPIDLSKAINLMDILPPLISRFTGK